MVLSGPANLHRWFGEMSPAGGGKLRIDEYLSQTNQSEVSIKIRGGRPGVEIKGLVAVCRSELVPFAPYVEPWCKWCLQASALEMTKTMIIQKTRDSGETATRLPYNARASLV
jgi:hypothetical protein